MAPYNLLERLSANIKNTQTTQNMIDEMFLNLIKECEYKTSTNGECGNLENYCFQEMGIMGEMRVCKVNCCPLLK